MSGIAPNTPPVSGMLHMNMGMSGITQQPTQQSVAAGNIRLPLLLTALFLSWCMLNLAGGRGVCVSPIKMTGVLVVPF